MAWRIDKQVLRGEIDSRTRGRVTGKIWLAGREEPVLLELTGNPWRDLAGQSLRFFNPNPEAGEPGELQGIASKQDGVVGDITASRKVRALDCSTDEFRKLYAARKPTPWHWANSLYLEWFSQRNGRVVIESADYRMELDPEPAWQMSEDEEMAQREANAHALTRFMDRLVTRMTGEPVLSDGDTDDDAPQSTAEAEADAEAARMNLLLDRVTARLEREGHNKGNFERIWEEERERLRRERGDPEPEALLPEQQAERDAWIEEVNAAAEEALTEMESEVRSGKDAWESRQHPLVARCSALSLRIHQDIERGGWLPPDAPFEHALTEISTGSMAAGAKLAGALNQAADEPWPPHPLYAGDTLVRLKKARDYLRDVLRGLDSADEENLAPLAWRIEIRREASEILGEVQERIHEVRQVLGEAGR